MPRGATVHWILLGRWPVWPIKPPVTDAAPRRVGAGMGHLPFDVAGVQPFPLPGGDRKARPGKGGAAAEGPIERRV